jgi:hypothetical protein
MQNIHGGKVYVEDKIKVEPQINSFVDSYAVERSPRPVPTGPVSLSDELDKLENSL